VSISTLDQTNINQRDRACELKHNQKTFWLHLNTAGSCCRSIPVDLNDFGSWHQLTNHWHQEYHLLKQGYEIESCQHCWQNEASGIKSWRQLGLPAHNQIELYFDNACNQMCSYCSPKFSTTWQKSIVDHGMLHNISQSAKNNLQIPVIRDNSSWLEQIETYIRSQPPNSISIKLLGGEPLMQRNSLQKLINLCQNNLKQLQINTNLNPPTDRFLRWILNTVPQDRLQFHISIDATPEFNHVPRGLFDKEKFLANLELIQQYQISYRFLSVTSVLSFFDLDRFVAWCKQHRHAHSFLSVYHPDCLDPKLLPAQFRQRINRTYLPKHILQIIDYDAAPVDLKLLEQYNYLQQYFARIDLNPHSINNDLFLEYWAWLENKFYENSNRFRSTP
jgi:sulfatase maturation enzyme AslB (radical SAM superfamily)